MTLDCQDGFLPGFLQVQMLHPLNHCIFQLQNNRQSGFGLSYRYQGLDWQIRFLAPQKLFRDYHFFCNNQQV